MGGIKMGKITNKERLEIYMNLLCWFLYLGKKDNSLRDQSIQSL